MSLILLTTVLLLLLQGPIIKNILAHLPEGHSSDLGDLRTYIGDRRGVCEP